MNNGEISTPLNEETVPKNQSKQHISSQVKELVGLVVSALVLAMLFQTYLFQPFTVEMESMFPTVKPSERVLVNKFIYRFKKPSRADIVTVYAPDEPVKVLKWGFWPSIDRKILIKRIIGLAGETIEFRSGQLYIDNKIIKEPYLKNIDPYSNFGPLRIPKNNVFVVGDNRSNSRDSRNFGPVKLTEVLGKTFAAYWPPTEIKIIP